MGQVVEYSLGSLVVMVVAYERRRGHEYDAKYTPFQVWQFADSGARDSRGRRRRGMITGDIIGQWMVVLGEGVIGDHDWRGLLSTTAHHDGGKVRCGTGQCLATTRPVPSISATRIVDWKIAHIVFVCGITVQINVILPHLFYQGTGLSCFPTAFQGIFERT